VLAQCIPAELSLKKKKRKKERKKKRKCCFNAEGIQMKTIAHGAE
jgi:hypothetical protein